MKLLPFTRESIQMTTAPEIAAVRVTYAIGASTRTDRLAMHADGNWYTYSLSGNRWLLTTTHGRHPVTNRAMTAEKAAWALELHVEEYYGITLKNIERD
jgi:hypothetical protein